jgi:hypothetical protein
MSGLLTLIEHDFTRLLRLLRGSKGLERKVPLAAYAEVLLASTVERCKDSFRCFQPMPLASLS